MDASRVGRSRAVRVDDAARDGSSPAAHGGMDGIGIRRTQYQHSIGARLCRRVPLRRRACPGNLRSDARDRRRLRSALPRRADRAGHAGRLALPAPRARDASRGNAQSSRRATVGAVAPKEPAGPLASLAGCPSSGCDRFPKPTWRSNMKRTFALATLVVLLLPVALAAKDSKDSRDSGNSLVRFEGGIGVDPVSSGQGTDPTATTVTRNIVRGVQPPGQIWRIEDLSANVKTDGHIRVDGRGLLLAGGNKPRPSTLM